MAYASSTLRISVDCGGTRAGGGRGIRTLDTVSRIHAFQACAFSRSATPPRGRTSPRGGNIATAQARTSAAAPQRNTGLLRKLTLLRRDARLLAGAPHGGPSNSSATHPDRR